MTDAPQQRLEDVSATARGGPLSNPIDRRMSKFLREPPSIRLAASVIVTATALLVVGAGILISLLDHSEYANVWVGMWWALQTVTTVGYGDVTPKEPSGRIVAAFVMLEGLALLAILTAAITSTFVARAARDYLAADSADEAAFEARLEARLDDLAGGLDRLAGRFDQLESKLGSSAASNDPAAPMGL